jgi:uncharacterized protein with HEPN domain
MFVNKVDRAALWDMLKAVREIQEDTKNLGYDDFLCNRLLRRAVERNFMILGEAANRVSREFCLAHSEIDWRGITGLRNILAHQYDTVRYEVLWEVISEMLTDLEHNLTFLLSSTEVD